jgi:hypothetical protein
MKELSQNGTRINRTDGQCAGGCGQATGGIELMRAREPSRSSASHTRAVPHVHMIHAVWGVLTAAILPVFHTCSELAVRVTAPRAETTTTPAALHTATHCLIAPAILARLRVLGELACPTSEPSSQHAACMVAQVRVWGIG